MKYFLPLAIGVVVTSAASAATVPFTESFSTDASNWRNSAGGANATWSSTDGADGGGYISETFNFSNSAVNDTPVLLRAQTSFNSSGDNFWGNWISEGVNEYRMSVRSHAAVPINFFARFVSPAGFPGAVALAFTPIVPETWTEIVIPISASNPQFISFETSDFNTIFSDIGRIQVGVSVPAALAGSTTPVTFDLDEVRIVPEPTSFAALLIGAMMTLRRRG